ncbi:MAG: RIP metalloprotease RseP [Gemmatimonadetes bacterium]|nr:RIP metalloprotease RseP [Gemmatimonadota bacterium]MYC71267.1 RIP metalloprotease RseP [Gemmatimonadota bacterium]MYI62516.1 RIP metalloprotease RseP [Gemmatimonadota bacterium]
MLDTLTTIASFLIALGVLVFVHELGHFLVAKWAGIRVERFSLGYPPKMIGFTRGETEYCISWIPFGGYVKVAGMADVGTEETTGARWEFPSRSVGIRMAVIAAGPAMNFLFAFVALIFLFSFYGIDSFDSTRVNPQENSLAAEVGLVRGDRVRTVGGTPVDNAYELASALDEISNSGATLEVERDGIRLNFDLPPAGDEGYGVQLMRPTTVGYVEPGMPADSLGLQEGDIILSVGQAPVVSWAEMSEEIRRYPGETIPLVWERDDQRMEQFITPATHPEGEAFVGRIGIGPQATRHTVGLGRAVVLGGLGVYNSSWLILDFLGELFQGDRSTDELGGPLRIAQLAGQTAEQGLHSFINFLAILSVNLAIINLLPIPVLDGGHLTFLTLEAIMRRPLSLRQREIFQQIGLAIMLFIMVFVTFNDLNQMVFRRIAEMF